MINTFLVKYSQNPYNARLAPSTGARWVGLFEISEKRELTLERLQLSSINHLLTILTLPSKVY